ncbi:MAG: hypothetical protein QME21_00125 [Anaerolineales bacterium]|nr:hypothetical protein [Anaerolineales bacterium]
MGIKTTPYLAATTEFAIEPGSCNRRWSRLPAGGQKTPPQVMQVIG